MVSKDVDFQDLHGLGPKGLEDRTRILHLDLHSDRTSAPYLHFFEIRMGWPSGLTAVAIQFNCSCSRTGLTKWSPDLMPLPWNTALRTMDLWIPKTGTFAAFDLLISTCRNTPSL